LPRSCVWERGSGMPRDGEAPEATGIGGDAPEVRALVGLADAVADALPLEELLGRVLDLLERSVAARAAWIHLLDETTGALPVRAARGRAAEALLGGTLRAAEGPLRRALASRAIGAASRHDPGGRSSLGDDLADAGIEQALVVPLVAAGRPVGLLVLCPADAGAVERPEPRLLVTLALFAAHAALAIQTGAARAEMTASRASAERTARRLGAIQRLEEAIGVVGDLPSLLGRGASLAAAALGGRHGAVALVEWPEAGRRLSGQIVLGTATETWADLPWRSLPLGRPAGLLSLLQARRRAVVLDRPGEDPRVGRFRGFLGAAGVRQLLVAPIISGGRLLGALAVDDGGRPTGRDVAPRPPFGDDDLGLAESLGARLGAAVDRIRLVQAERRRARELLALQRTTQHLASTLSLPDLLPVVAREAANLLEVEAALLRLREGDDLVLAAHSTTVAIEPPPTRVPLVDSLSGFVIGKGGPVTIHDLQADPRAQSRRVWREDGFRSYLGVPIRGDGGIAGVLGLYSRPRRRFEARDAELAATLADVVAVALDNARLFERASLGVQQWQTSFDAMRDGIAVVDAAGRVRRANAALLRMLDLGPDDVVGRQFQEFFPGLAPGGEALRAGRIVALDVSQLSDSEGRAAGAVHAVRDVTAERRLQEQLLQSEKLASIGQLISGVAHELNNPLAAILGYAELLQRKARDPGLIRDIDQVRAQTERATRIVHNLLAFARKQRPETRRISLNEATRAALELQGYDLRVNNIHVEALLDPQLPAVLADFHQIEEVIVNVLVNAKQAIQSARRQGRIIVETRAVPPAEGRAAARLTVRDNGPGIPKEHLSRVFDPFFTTKPVGVGTGLGLSICFGVVEAHGGRIWIDSQPGAGAAVTIELPAAASPDDRPAQACQRRANAPTAAPSLAPAPPAYAADPGPVAPGAPEDRPAKTSSRPRPGAPAAPARATPRVLVVDDEPSIRDVVSSILALEGYEVEAAEDGIAAAAHLAAAPFDLVIADVKMPGMGGLELADWIAAHRPAFFDRLVFMTGDTVAPSTRRLLEGSGRPFIAKPFGHTELTALVAAALEQARSALAP